MKNKTLKTALILMFLLVAEFVFSQSTPPPNRVPGPPGLPIDGGIFTLIAVAFGYGISKLRNKK